MFRTRLIRTAVLFLLVFLTPAVGLAGNGQKEKVKNVVFMVGDGMGVAHVTALMLDGKYAPIAMERAQAVGLVKTYSANNRVTDSGASATAYATGHKTNNSQLSVDVNGKPMETILEKAIQKGMKTGLVVTCDMTGATPAAFYSHVSSRKDVESIAAQLVDKPIDIWMGGGRQPFEKRKDGRNLLDELKEKNYQLIFDTKQIEDLQNGKVAGLFSEKGYMPEYSQRGNYLPEATAKTLELLNQDNKKGFFLLVEGSQIDRGGHRNNSELIIGETRDFDNAVGVVMDFAEKNPGTLVVILADHETGGLAIPANDADFNKGENGIQFHFSGKGHTGTMVPVLAYGPGAENFSRILDNTEISALLKKLMQLD